MEKLAVASGADLVDGRGVEIDEERTRDVLAATGLGEEGLEGTRVTDILEVGVGTAVWS